MKVRLLILAFLMSVGSVFAQPYPLVTIHDIQYIDSVSSKGFVNSPLVGDTVRVRGAVMVRPVVDPVNNRNPIMYYGPRWGTYIEDTSNIGGWGGLNVLIDTSVSGYQNTFFDLIDTAQIVEFTGVVNAYGQTNELFQIPNTAVNILPNSPPTIRPKPIKLSISDFMQNAQSIDSSYKYSGMYVELSNGISADRNTGTGQFNLYDKDGNYVTVYPQSRYFRLDANKMPGSTYQVPQDGTPINYVRGIITVYNSGFEILPLYPDDISIEATPPIISNVKRDKIQVNTNQSVTISANIEMLDGYVKNAALHYQIDAGNKVVVPMQKSLTDTTLYTATIPGVSTDSSMVDYYISSLGSNTLVGYTPSDTVKGNYFYQVLNENLTIRDVQYSPFGSGFSGYNGYHVTISGIVTADTSDYPGRYSANYPERVYVQEGSGPWTGIMIGTHGAKGVDVLKLVRGDSVTLTGVIMESYSVTTIDSLSQITVNSSSNPLPASVTLSTGTIDKNGNAVVASEQWESVLINYKNVTVTDENADGNPGPLVSGTNNNYGEMFVSDGSGDTRISLQDGNNNYVNDWDASFVGDTSKIHIKTNNTFSELQGILYYSFSYYKLCPRKADDFMGLVTAIKKNTPNTPQNYELAQNYPNPFNPATIISYSLPKESFVTLRIYNILGQQVGNLVNKNQMAGTYKVNFNASDLSSGVYFYMIKAGNFRQIKKMVLLK
jgi:hypothetical protein